MPLYIEPAEEAHHLLAQMEIEPYASEALEVAINRLVSQPHVSKVHLRQLDWWPREKVRAALLARLSTGIANAAVLFFFQWFASATDRHIFERYECDPRIAVADVAHRYLEG